MGGNQNFADHQLEDYDKYAVEPLNAHGNIYFNNISGYTPGRNSIWSFRYNNLNVAIPGLEVQNKSL